MTLDALMNRSGFHPRLPLYSSLAGSCLISLPFVCVCVCVVGLPRWLSGKEPACHAGDMGYILGEEYPLEKEMATHCSTLVWDIPWTEEPGRLQSMGSQKDIT